MPLLDSAELSRIEAVVTDVEKRTSGEIVVASVAESDDYADLRCLFAFAMGIVGAVSVHVAWPELEASWLFWIEILVTVLSFFLTGVAPVLRTLVPRTRAIESVERRAREAFFEHDVFETRERTGVLIFVSELEHRVVILGDKGIDAQVHKQGWEHHVDTIITAIRGRRAADGICTVIAELGEVLAAHMPARSDDTNELPNAVKQEPE
jgi:putative membrane protein